MNEQHSKFIYRAHATESVSELEVTMELVSEMGIEIEIG